jgi:malate synthase
MGGMAAFIPSRRRPEINEAAIEKVRADKEREAGDGFDGTWVAHPDLVPVAMAEFDSVLDGRDNQVERQREDVEVTATELLDARSAGGDITDEGLRNDINVGIQYISSWLRGNGAAAIFNLMEDAATAEIARSQVWQWVFHGVELDTGERVTADLVRRYAGEELEKIREQVGDEFFRSQGRPEESRALFEQVALGDDFAEFLTLPAYELIP